MEVKIYKHHKHMYNPMTGVYGMKVFHMYALEPFEIEVPRAYRILSDGSDTYILPEGYTTNGKVIYDSIGNPVELGDFGCKPALIPKNSSEDIIILEKK